jgi:hypothetical protein
MEKERDSVGTVARLMQFRHVAMRSENLTVHVQTMGTIACLWLWF